MFVRLFICSPLGRIQLKTVADNVRNPSIFQKGSRFLNSPFQFKAFWPAVLVAFPHVMLGSRYHIPRSYCKPSRTIWNSILWVHPSTSLCHFNVEIMWNLVLGFAEAGLFPGTIYVFSVYYRRHERSWRVALFFGGAALAGAFGGQILLT